MSLVTIFAPQPQPQPSQPPAQNTETNEANTSTNTPPPAAQTEDSADTNTASGQSGAGTGDGTNTGGTLITAAREERQQALLAKADSPSVIAAQTSSIEDQSEANARRAALAAMEEARNAFLIEELKVSKPQDPISNLTPVEDLAAPQSPAEAQTQKRTA